MEKIGLSRILSIIFLTFGITYTNLDSLSFESNYKAYISLLIGIAILIFSFLKPKHSDSKKS